MFTNTEEQTIIHYESEVIPAVSSTDPEMAKTLAWADANPLVWKIVSDTRSKAFGRIMPETELCRAL